MYSWQKMEHRLVTWTAVALTMATLMLVTPMAAAHGASDPACDNAGQQPDLIAARADLQHTPDVLSKRIKLADLLMSAGCNDEAVSVLEAGLSANPRNADVLQYRLNRARSMLKEKQYFEGLDQAEAVAQLRRAVLRCTQLSDLAACDNVLSMQPNNLEILVAKGNALIKVNRVDDAIAEYSHAVQLAPANTLIAGRLQAAQSLRQLLQTRCSTGEGDAALQACQAVLVKGSKDEFATTVRLAVLQQTNNQSAQALDSFIAANSLRPGDKSVALAILALLDSTQRKDAIALAARGSSLLTLGRASEAVTALRQAAALTTSLPDLNQQLASAEALARSQEQPHTSAHAPVSATAATERVAAAPAAHTSFSNIEPASRSN